jgi:hypothetical protein
MSTHKRLDFTNDEMQCVYKNIKNVADRYFGEGNYRLCNVDDPNAPRYKIIPKLFDCNGKFALRLQCKNLVRFISVEFILNKYSDNEFGMRVQVCGNFKGYRKKNSEMYRIISLEDDRSFLVLEFSRDINKLIGENTTSLFDRVLTELKNAKPTKIEIDYWK